MQIEWANTYLKGVLNVTLILVLWPDEDEDIEDAPPGLA